MLTKCAHPECSTTLLYLREGKIFKVESDVNSAIAPDSRKQPRKVEHFWLCGPCSEHSTLFYDKDGGIRVEAKSLARRAAAS